MLPSTTTISSSEFDSSTDDAVFLYRTATFIERDDTLQKYSKKEPKNLHTSLVETYGLNPYYPPNPQYAAAAYAPNGAVYYSQPQHMHEAPRKRAYEYEVSQFVEDVKRHKFGGGGYTPEVASRFASIHSLVGHVPMEHSGYAMHHQPSIISAAPMHGGIHTTYQLPHPGPIAYSRKADLVEADQFLHQLSTSLYENPAVAAAAGVAHPGAHYTHTGLSYNRTPSIPSPHSPHSISSHHSSISAPQHSPGHVYSPHHDSECSSLIELLHTIDD